MDRSWPLKGLIFGCGWDKLGDSHSCSLNTCSWPMLGGKAASASQRKGFPGSEPAIPATLFWLLHFQSGTIWCKAETFDLCLWWWLFVTAISCCEGEPWQTVCWTLGLWPWLPGNKGSLFCRPVWGSIVLLQWTTDCGYFSLGQEADMSQVGQSVEEEPKRPKARITFGQSKR